MAWIVGYGLTSAAGDTVEAFWRGLRNGIDHSRPVPFDLPAKACLWPDNLSAVLSVKELLVRHLLKSWEESLAKAIPAGRERLLRGPTGVILASTKGCAEDFVWNPNPGKESERDPIAPVLEEFLRRSEMRSEVSACVSNACSSSLAAVWLAAAWLRQKRVANVLILACDRIGPFVLRGFRTLQAIASDRTRPFGRTRDGLQMGDASAALWLSSESAGDAPELLSVEMVSDGSPVTRPSASGEGLRKACLQIPGIQGRNVPDLIVAHGTGTVMNDAAENEAFESVFGDRVSGIPVTGTKWSVGHTMGASAAVDLVAACEVLRRQSAFRLANTDEVDPSFRGRYLHASAELQEPFHAERVLVTSLGFGGVHAAALVRKAS